MRDPQQLMLIIAQLIRLACPEQQCLDIDANAEAPRTSSTVYSPTRTLRSLQTRQATSQSSQDSSYIPWRPSVFQMRSMPPSLISAPSLACFKQGLKTRLFKRAYFSMFLFLPDNCRLALLF